MTLLPSATPLQLAAQAGAEATHYAVTVYRAQYSAVWDRDPTTVLAELNADVENSLLLMSLHQQAVTANNALLDAINDPRYPTRAQTSMPTGWAFDGTAFTYTPPPPPPVEDGPPPITP